MEVLRQDKPHVERNYASDPTMKGADNIAKTVAVSTTKAEVDLYLKANNKEAVETMDTNNRTSPGPNAKDDKDANLAPSGNDKLSVDKDDEKKKIKQEKFKLQRQWHTLIQ